MVLLIARLQQNDCGTGMHYIALFQQNDCGTGMHYIARLQQNDYNTKGRKLLPPALLSVLKIMYCGSAGEPFTSAALSLGNYFFRMYSAP